MTIENINLNPLSTDNFSDFEKEVPKFMKSSGFAEYELPYRLIDYESDEEKILWRKNNLYLLKDNDNYLWGIIIIRNVAFFRIMGKDDIYANGLDFINYICNYGSEDPDDEEIDDVFDLSNKVWVQIFTVNSTDCYKFSFNSPRELIESIQLIRKRCEEENFEGFQVWDATTIRMSRYYPTLNKPKLNYQDAANLFKKYITNIKYADVPEAVYDPMEKDAINLSECFKRIAPNNKDIDLWEFHDYNISSSKTVEQKKIKIGRISIENISYYFFQKNNKCHIFCEPSYCYSLILFAVLQKSFIYYNSFERWKETPFYLGTIEGKTNNDKLESVISFFESKGRVNEAFFHNEKNMQFILKSMFEKN